MTGTNTGIGAPPSRADAHAPAPPRGAAPAPEGVPASGSSGSGRWVRLGPPLVTAVAGALVALASAYLLWPHGGVNLDEVVYLNQAEAIADGRLTLDADSFVPDFRPYLTGVADGRVVFKYQPLWPGLLAVSDRATGDHRPALVLAGAGAALAFGLLGRELTGRRRLGAVTGVGVALSPLFVTHAGTALAYLPAGALAAAAVAAGLRAVRTGGRWWYAATGAGFGILFFHRPYDAVVAGVPVAVWLLTRAVRSRSPGGVALAGAAAAPFVALWLAYNRLVTGSAFDAAFSVSAPDDRFGFGRRASWTPTNPTFERHPLDFTPWGGIKTAFNFAAYTPLFVAGGVVVLALAAYAVGTGWHDPRRRLLAAVVATVVVGHLFWWGTQNFANFGLNRVLGPAYWLGGLGPLAALATAGGADAWVRAQDLPAERRRRLLVAGGAALLASTVATAAIVGPNVVRARRHRQHQVDVIGAGPVNSVLILPGGVDDPFVHAVVPVDLGGADRLDAVDLGSADQIFRLRDDDPGRALWAWMPVRRSGGFAKPPGRYRLGELPDLRAPAATLRLDPVAGGATVTEAYLRTIDFTGQEIDRTALDPPAVDAPVVARVGPRGGAASGARADMEVGPEPVWLAVGATLEREGRPPDVVEVRWPVRSRAGEVEVGGTGIGWRYYAFPETSRWSMEDVSDAAAGSVDGLPVFRPVASEHEMP